MKTPRVSMIESLHSKSLMVDPEPKTSACMSEDLLDRLDDWSLVDILKFVLIENNPSARSLIERGKDIPIGSMAWLDALREGSLPEMYWGVSDDSVSFIEPHPETLSESVFEAATMGGQNILVASRVHKEVEIEDEFTGYRRDFQACISERFLTLMFLLRSGVISSTGIPPGRTKRISIDRDLWKDDSWIIVLNSDAICDEKGRIIMRALRFADPNLETQEGAGIEGSITKKQRGRPLPTNWDLVMELFVNHCVSKGKWPLRKVEAAALIHDLMAEAGMKAVSRDETISKNMEKKLGKLWTNIPKG